MWSPCSEAMLPRGVQGASILAPRVPRLAEPEVGADFEREIARSAAIVNVR